LAVWLITIVTGSGPQEKRMIPPARTAATTAAEVQLAAVPLPTTWLGWEVSTARPAAGTGTARTPGADPRAIEAAAGGAQPRSRSEHRLATRSDARRRIPQA
jgi:hypothetical protein